MTLVLNRKNDENRFYERLVYRKGGGGKVKGKEIKIESKTSKEKRYQQPTTTTTTTNKNNIWVYITKIAHQYY